ncbi:hypothetical protein [Candidatus Harpocratesius sp.]
MTREFYCVSLIKELKDQKLPILMPAKKFQKVKRHYERILLRNRELNAIYLFSRAK